MCRGPADLDGDELWQRVARTVRPLHEVRVRRDGQGADINPALIASGQGGVGADKLNDISSVKKVKGRVPPLRPPASTLRPDTSRTVEIAPSTLDGGWDKRLRRGVIQPDRTVDLHGMRLDGAHLALDRAIDSALANGERVLLVIAGLERPQLHRGDRPRGVIRASLNDWLRYGRHAQAIAAIRNAHPRHGGAGAVYVIFKRRR